MGVYLNPKNKGFTDAARSEIYVDKTGLIAYANKSCRGAGEYLCGDGQGIYLSKDQPYVALACMTGILPVKKYGEHSALNMFREYAMTGQKALEEYTGFTEEEVKGLCERFGMDFDGLRTDIVQMLGGRKD